MRRRRQVELVRARPLSPSVRSLVFRFTDGAPFVFEAGQYVDLFAPTARGFVFKRPYSIASAPASAAAGAPAEIELAVTHVEDGPLSTALHDMPIGARAEVEGPSGVFTMRGSREDDALFVATGSGLAPLRAMLAADLEGPREAREAGESEPARGRRVLLFGVRTEADILWREELEAWEARYPRFRLEVTLSRGAVAKSGAVEHGGAVLPSAKTRAPREGYVQRHVGELVGALGLVLGHAPNVYVCGLSRMTDEVTRILEGELGVPHERVHYETYD